MTTTPRKLAAPGTTAATSGAATADAVKGAKEDVTRSASKVETICCITMKYDVQDFTFMGISRT